MPKDSEKKPIKKTVTKKPIKTTKSKTTKKPIKKVEKKITEKETSIKSESKHKISKPKKTKSSNPALIISSIFIAISLVFIGIQIGQTNGNIDDELLEAKIQKIVLQNIKNAGTTKEKSKLDYVPSISDADHVYGDKNAKISLIEYSNYDCGYCRRFHVTAKDLVDTYDGKLNWTYRNSISSTNQIAMSKANTAECIAETVNEKAFWDFIEITLNSRANTLNDILSNAEKVGANKSKIKTCLQKDNYSKKIKGEITDFMLGGMRGTPANVFRNNDTGESILIEGALPKDKLEAVIDRMLK